MAVTQQLARLTAAELALCRRSVEALDDLCGLRMRPPTDHLDLDWSPAMISRAAVLAGVPADVRQALGRALAGDVEINPAYRAVPGVSEHPVCAVSARDVRELAASLQTLTPRQLVAGLSADGGEVMRALGWDERLMEDPRGYVTTHYDALRGFYHQAADRELAVAAWWD